MDVIQIEAGLRDTGKRAARDTRAKGNVPCIIYGHGQDSVAVEIDAKALKPLIYTHETHRISISAGGKSWDCILKTLDLDPVTEHPLHVDFQALRAGEKVTLTIPMNFIGVPVGQTAQGGSTQYILNEVTITCLPKDIPSTVDVDISALNIGESVHIRDLQLPGIEFNEGQDVTVVTVSAPRVEAAATEEESLLGATDEAEEEEL